MTASGRVRVVDLLRLLAAFQMVQGHTIDAVLADEARAGAWFSAWSWARGLTSVAFLFVTGLSFHLASVANLERHLADPEAIGRRLRRGALLIAIGYALHLPLFAAEADAAALLRTAAVVDVLQTLGVSLWLLEGTLLLLRSARAAGLVWAASGIVLLALAPFAAGVSPEGPLLPLLNYVSPRAGSVFPLVPWMAHVLLGAALAPWLLAASPRARSARFALAAALLFALGAIVTHAGWALPGLHVTRLGAVLAVGAVLSAFEQAAEGLPAWAWRLSGETLFIYALHIVLVYGSGPSLRSLVGHALPWLPALGVALGMVLLSAASALAYPRLTRGLARGAEAG